MTRRRRPHALIVGGGVGGLTAALCLAATGWRISVFEQARALGAVGAGIQLSPNAARVLHALGLADALEQAAIEPPFGHVRHWRSGAPIASMPLGDHVRRRYGAPYYQFHRAGLLAVLGRAVAAEPAAVLRCGLAAADVRDADGRPAVLAGGEWHEADLLIGADGAHSVVRSIVLGTDGPTFTGCVAWRTLVDAEAVPGELARPGANLWWGPGRHFVYYPVREPAQGRTLVNCVGVVAEDAPWLAESWSARGDKAQFQRAFRGWHDSVAMLIDRADADACFRWALLDRRPLPSWHKGRVVVLGDACHPVLPYLAQGAALAIEDAAVLANCVASDGDVQRALGRYERLRKPRAAYVQAASRRNGRIYHWTGAAAWLRDRLAPLAAARTTRKVYAYDACATGAAGCASCGPPDVA